MPYLLDSTLVVDYLFGDQAAKKRLQEFPPGEVFISVVTYLEVYEGVLTRPNVAARKAKLRRFVEAVPILALSTAVARRCAELRKTLREQGRRVDQRALDLIIAATALEHHLTLVTRNVEDFRDIPGLQLFGQESGKAA